MRRDIDRLRELDYLIKTLKGPAGGYRPEAGAHLPPMLFDDQAVALAVAPRTAAAGTTVAEDAAHALAALRQVMPSRLHHRIDLSYITTVQPPAAAGGTPGSTLRS